MPAENDFDSGKDSARPGSSQKKFTQWFGVNKEPSGEHRMADTLSRITEARLLAKDYISCKY